MIHKLLIASLAALPLICSAQVNFTFTDRKSGYQHNPKSITYEGGDLAIDHMDGSWSVAPCAYNGGAYMAFPDPFCPLGTTGFLWFGDLDGDGVYDNGSFWSLSEAPVRSLVTEPFDPVGLRCESAPYSEFPRPGVLPVRDGSIRLGYNMLNSWSQLEYEVARYHWFEEFEADENGREQHDKTSVLSGAYTFSVPRLNQPSYIRLMVPFTKYVLPESYPGWHNASLKSGFRFDNDDDWGADGYLEFDPRLNTSITWQGITPGVNYVPNFDELRLWMLEDPFVDPFQIPGYEANVKFPPGGGALLLDYESNVLTGSYRLPGLFFEIGDEVVTYLRMDRALPTLNSIAVDTSVRVWMVNMRFVDTYSGFALFSGIFPVGTSEKHRATGYDYDGDGASNLLEFGLNTDPTDPGSNPVAEGKVVPVIEGDYWVVAVEKRPNVGDTLSYAIEYSEDINTWTRIKKNDPNWEIVIDDADQIKVRSKFTVIEGPGAFYVRAAISLN